jgi:hypothetical protein
MAPSDPTQTARQSHVQRLIKSAMLFLLCLILVGFPIPFITLYYPISYHVQTGIMIALALALFWIIKTVKAK